VLQEVVVVEQSLPRLAHPVPHQDGHKCRGGGCGDPAGWERWEEWCMLCTRSVGSAMSVIDSSVHFGRLWAVRC
jgi:hypothetical protein